MRSRYSKASSRITRRSKAHHLFSLLVRFGLPLFVLLGAIFLLRSNPFQIKEVSVSGNKEIKTEDIKSLAEASLAGSYFFVIPKTNLVFFDTDRLKEKIIKDLPRVGFIDVSKNLDGTLQIELQERLGEFVWCSTEEKGFLMSSSGLVFVEATTEEMENKIVFRGNITGDPLMQNFANESLMQSFLGAIKIFEEGGLKVSSVDFALPDKAIFYTDTGSVFLNPEEDLYLSVPNALVLVEEIKSKNVGAKFEYIDARFGNKVFYKLK